MIRPVNQTGHMDDRIGASEFTAKCLSLLDQVAQTGRPLTITKRGKVVAQLVPAPLEITGYPQHSLFDTVEVLGDIVGPSLKAEDLNLEDGLL